MDPTTPETGRLVSSRIACTVDGSALSQKGECVILTWFEWVKALDF